MLICHPVILISDTILGIENDLQLLSSSVTEEERPIYQHNICAENIVA